MKIDPNAPAMPHSYEWSHRGEDFSATEHGLTIRAHFAAMAMQGMMANPSLQTADPAIYAKVASHALLHADALIAELNK